MVFVSVLALFWRWCSGAVQLMVSAVLAVVLLFGLFSDGVLVVLSSLPAISN